MSDKVRVRIAPSPTGNLHLGTARTALYNYLFAKHNKGSFIFRIEDTDAERSNETFTKDIIDGLKWLGMNWDEGPDIGGPCAPYRQTEKIDHYNHMANQLMSSGAAYFCFCTPEELEAMREEQKAKGQASRYNNHCRDLSNGKRQSFEAAGRIPSIRFRIDEPRIVAWHDAIKGQIEISSSDLGGDMVIVKSSGISTYNFAVVVDDIDMKMTHVIRGEDHIHNTAKQLLLYEALGAKPPVFGHVALIFDTEKRKMSKRNHGEAVHIEKYKQDGYLPEAMINYLAQMSWTPSDGREIFTLSEGCEMFDLERVSKSPAIFDIKRLHWFNSHYIRSKSIAEITDMSLPYLKDYDLSSYNRQQLEELVSSVRDGLTVLSEIKEAVSIFFDNKVTIASDLQDTLKKESSIKVLQAVLEKVDAFPYGDHPGCKAIVDTVGKELGVKGKDLYWPIRITLSGMTHGPDLGSIISILGPNRIKQRLETALKLCLQH